MSTLKGIGPGGWDSGKLARSQDGSGAEDCSADILKRHAPSSLKLQRCFRIYTENVWDRYELADVVSRYFAGATIVSGLFGLWHGELEDSVVIEIAGEPSDLQGIVNLAGDIKELGRQTSVLVTWHDVHRMDV